MYPEYPEGRDNPTPEGTFPKDNYSELVDLYDELAGVGLTVLPKWRTKKYPMGKYWSKGANPPTRQQALQEQKRSDVSGWCVATGDVYVLDLDTAELIANGHNPEDIYEKIQFLSMTGFVLRTPANGVHMYYRIPAGKYALGNDAPPIDGVDARGVGGQVVSLGGYNRYEDDYATQKGVVNNHTGAYEKLPSGDYTHIPFMSQELYDWVKSEPDFIRPKTSRNIRGENYGKTEAGRKRVKRHFKQSPKDRESIVIEVLEIILENWDDNAPYEDWIQLWMAAYHGSSGSLAVRDYILSHKGIHWSNGKSGKRHFKQAWAVHEPKEDGYTVASLFWLARELGWLKTTGYEIPDVLAETIEYRYISEWVDSLNEIPERLVLQSQTGTGKTYNIPNLWRRIGEPKAVIFVPTIKLATELAYTLRDYHDMSATLYIDDETQEIKPAEELAEAKVLVTTLQTFATKVYPHVFMEDYGLVYVEESDQLIQQFSRGGGGHYTTHVSDYEAREGYKVLRKAMEDSGYVWYVDATMTAATKMFAEVTAKDKIVDVVKNKYIADKPTVNFLQSVGQAYQTVLGALLKGKQVVVSSDTKSRALECLQTMRDIGVLDAKKSMLLTADTKHKPEVSAFMKDINTHAPEYDLIVYSPVMASGVSVTSYTPDVLVQISTYLTPRSNLQMLNRFRKQSKVYCYYQNRENLYAKQAKEILEDAKKRADVESSSLHIPLAQRDNDALLRSEIAAISVGDTQLQMRAPKDFYQALLEGDGRNVMHSGHETPSEELKHTLEGVREAKKERQEYIAKNWHTVPKVDRDNPPDPSATDLEVAMGEKRAYIERCLFGNVPEDVEPEYVYEVVDEFGRYGYALNSFINQKSAIERAGNYLTDSGKAIMALSNNITLNKVLGDLHYLYEGLDDTLTPEKLEQRAKTFVEKIRLHADEYDSLMTRNRQKLESIEEKNENVVDLALALSKIILSKVGLKQRSYRDNREGGEATYHYEVRNRDKVIDFLSWREKEEPDISFDASKIEEAKQLNLDANRVYQKFDDDEQKQVFELMSNEFTFEQAVRKVKQGIVW